MQVDLLTSAKLTPAALAAALADADPDDFANFWFAFAERMDARDGPDKLLAFAQAMAPNFGGKRKAPLKELARLVEYFETRHSLGEAT